MTVSLGAHAAQEPGLDISAPGSSQRYRHLIGHTGTQRATHGHYSISLKVCCPPKGFDLCTYLIPEDSSSNVNVRCERETFLLQVFVCDKVKSSDWQCHHDPLIGLGMTPREAQ